MPLRSPLFDGDPKLNAASEQDLGHITPGAIGDHVVKIQMALEILDSAAIPEGERSSKTYGPGTAAAVLAYKTARNIVNPAIQAQPDNIVGIRTIKSMDDELAGAGAGRPEMIANAHARSRQSLRSVETRLQSLQTEINRVDGLPEPDKGVALAGLLVSSARDIRVISGRLLVSADPLSASFRQALQATLDLIRSNLAQPFTVMDGGALGRCTPGPDGGMPFASTAAAAPNPQVSLCDPFFVQATDLQRDVVTHEYFHLVGLGDHAVTKTSEGLTNANTMAQVVAFLFDRFRQRNSDGNEPTNPPLPAP
ncbi:MAG TPA: hypothetical protein VHM31_21425 [Polyangia bacterium]|nr:hypothetical protein [Polyangia bacterium]